MSKIKLTGHASGSGVLTIAAPNTDTDRTITLPDVTGTLLDSGSTLDATKLTGALPAISGASLTGVLPLAGGTMTGNIVHGDNVKDTYGASADLEIYHDGSNSIIHDNGTGNLLLKGDNLSLRSSGNESYVTGIANGAVELYYDNSKKIETTSGGIEVTGDSKATRIVGRGIIENSSGVSGDTWAVMGLNTTNAAGSGGAVFGSKHADSNSLLVGSHDATFNSFAVKGDGKVGIGTASPNARLHVYNANDHTRLKVECAQNSGQAWMFQSRNNGEFWIRNDSGSGLNPVVIGSDGRILAGEGSFAGGAETLTIRPVTDGGVNDYVLMLQTGTTNSATIIRFYTPNGVAGVVSTSGSSTSYGTSSDYRLKENVDYDWDATTRLKQLKPARFNWIEDDTNTLQDGFIAHEVSSVVPEAISGEKDGMETYTDENGDEKTRIAPQSIDQSKLVPLLVKTIQELEARITTLEG